MSESVVLYIGEKNISSWSMRAWVALKHKGIAFEERTIALREDKDRAQRRKIGPTGKVPVLQHGGLTIPDSLAIVEYLDEAFPAPRHPAMWPSDVAQRAHARWLAAAMHSGFAKVREHMSFNWCFLAQQPPLPADALEEAREMLGYWEAALGRKPAGGPYLFGAFTAADVMYAPAVVRLVSFRVPTDGFPLAAAYMPAVLEAPAVRGWMEEARKLPPREAY